MVEATILNFVEKWTLRIEQIDATWSTTHTHILGQQKLVNQGCATLAILMTRENMTI